MGLGGVEGALTGSEGEEEGVGEEGGEGVEGEKGGVEGGGGGRHLY